MDDIARKNKIALIDDEKGLVETIKAFLETRNFSVVCAYDGLSGLDLVKKEMPDIIILDIMMPKKDGRDTLVELKKSADTKNIPVIVLTAKDEQFVRNYMLELGAYEFIAKPYDSYALLRQITNVLKKKAEGRD
jgi:two-component system alkaline phosphatase synthesis response regulator PhoP